MAGRQTYDREFDPWPVRGCAVTVGKLFTPTCFDADSLCYCMESLESGCIYLYLWTVCECQEWRATLAADRGDAGVAQERRQVAEHSYPPLSVQVDDDELSVVAGTHDVDSGDDRFDDFRAL